MKRKGKVFIDANVLIHATSYRSADIFQWIDLLYEEVYIHQMVLEELKITDVRKKVEDYIQQGKWHLFDPDDEKTLSDNLFDIYEGYVRDIRYAFADLNQKKINEGRPLKNASDLGEMHSLAATMLLGASIICSNDYDIREVIEDTPILVTLDEEKESVLVEQDTLVDFCFFVITYDIANQSVARKFLKAIQPNKIIELDNRLSSND
ncbi:hypothetical protein SAMN05880501_11350 [Ureibacillus xyleni]|uniref:PIN domain-containing protein n=1 Tax=Ureibacillus xyleni TaxID=614648 RepID=A0A285TMH8_9BACL|nr:hypothetical protein [Ureibacillus xyleni]SOC21723.1 hypothetical protein SAMN05880501_11350 [Ureibacillus xyleni]